VLSDGTYRCGITIRLDGYWLERWSRPYPDLFDEFPETHPYDAFNEACLKWGMGRYLTVLPLIWVEARITPTDQGLPRVLSFDQFVARAQLGRMLAETQQTEGHSTDQGGCPVCEKRRQLLFDIEELQVTLNRNGDCLTLDWPAIRTFSVEKLVVFHAGLKSRLQMLFEDTTPPHLLPGKTQAKKKPK
jgi:hypothetical protein